MHVSTMGKKLAKWQYLLHMSSQYGELGPLTAEICWRVWGTPANFNRFHILHLLVERRCSPEANQTLHDVWPSPGLIHYIYISWDSWPVMEFCQVLCCPILAALLHGTRVVGVSQTAVAEGATYIWHDGHHVGHWPTF